MKLKQKLLDLTVFAAVIAGLIIIIPDNSNKNKIKDKEKKESILFSVANTVKEPSRRPSESED